jgi:ribosomal protein L7/L12
MCPSCKYEAFAGDVEPVIKEGYKCTNCSYKTEPGNDSLNKLVVIFLKEKKLIKAVKLYQSATKKGLKESKKGVDQIAAKYNIKMKQGCFIVLPYYISFVK